MFLPVGPDVEVSSSSGTPSATLSFSGIDRDNAVLRVAVTTPGHADLVFTVPGAPVSMSLYSGETFCHIPQDATSVIVTASSAPSGISSVNTSVSLTVGQYF